MARCATVGCRNEATERISYRYQGGQETGTDDVCTPCAGDYERRPALQDFTRAPLTARAGMSQEEFEFMSRTGETFASYEAHHMYDAPGD